MSLEFILSSMFYVMFRFRKCTTFNWTKTRTSVSPSQRPIYVISSIRGKEARRHSPPPSPSSDQKNISRPAHSSSSVVSLLLFLYILFQAFSTSVQSNPDKHTPLTPQNPTRDVMSLLLNVGEHSFCGFFAVVEFLGDFFSSILILILLYLFTSSLQICNPFV